jgi:hypothetical protein
MAGASFFPHPAKSEVISRANMRRIAFLVISSKTDND